MGIESQMFSARRNLKATVNQLNTFYFKNFPANVYMLLNASGDNLTM